MLTSLIVIAKVRFSQTFFCVESLFQRVWLRLCTVLNGHNWFS